MPVAWRYPPKGGLVWVLGAMLLLRRATTNVFYTPHLRYTALMSVCSKCGRLQLAVDIYDAMRKLAIAPNVVTFNTLVDVYGKLGRWQDAMDVLDVMRTEVSYCPPPTKWNARQSHAMTCCATYMRRRVYDSTPVSENMPHCFEAPLCCLLHLLHITLCAKPVHSVCWQLCLYACLMGCHIISLRCTLAVRCVCLL
jgi:pentatricopeptide repeat protein